MVMVWSIMIVSPPSPHLETGPKFRSLSYGVNQRGTHMNKVILNQAALTKLNQLKEGAEICDKTGRVVGFFTPAVDSSLYEVENPPSEEELDAIEQQLDGRPLADIMRDLKGKS